MIHFATSFAVGRRDAPDPQAVNAKSRTLAGWAIRFGAPIDCEPPSIVQRGAFTKTLQEQRGRIRVLAFHDNAKILGIPAKLEERQEGLWLEAQLAETPLADEILALAKLGAIDAWSIGFDPIKSQMVGPEKLAKHGATDAAIRDAFEAAAPVRVITEVRLWEISAVPFPAESTARMVPADAGLEAKLAEMRIATRLAEMSR